MKSSGEPDPKIILVGVVHGDPQGYDKLYKLLRRYRPRLISVEISEYSWRYRRRRQGRWQRQFQLASRELPPELRRHLAVQQVAAQIAYPFEVKAAADYAREHGATWRAVDLNRIAREHLPRYESELLSPDNLRQLILTADADWQEYIRQEYQRARKVLQADSCRGLMPTATLNSPLSPAKSAVLASPLSPRGERVRVRGELEIAGDNKPKGSAQSPQTTLREKVLAHRVARLAKEWSKIVHVGGWEHLIRSEENINLFSVTRSSVLSPRLRLWPISWRPGSRKSYYWIKAVLNSEWQRQARIFFSITQSSVLT